MQQRFRDVAVCAAVVLLLGMQARGQSDVSPALVARDAALPTIAQNGAAPLTISNELVLSAVTTVGGTGVGEVTLAGAISGTGSLTKTTSGTLTVGGETANTWSGGTTVESGTLVLNRSRANLGTGAITLAGGTTFYTSNFEGNSSGGAIPNTFQLAGGIVTLWTYKDIWITGPINGPGGLLVTGSGKGQGVTLSGAKTFSGGVTLSPVRGATPTLSIDNVQSLGTGTLRCEITSADVNGANLRSTALVVAPPGVTNTIDIEPGCRLVVSADGGNNLWLSGAITNGGSLLKTGAATLTLSGASRYTGATRVRSGALVCSGAASLGCGALDIGAGAKVRLDYVGTRTIEQLSFAGGAPQPAGTYGSSASPASTKDDVHFAGIGTVTVGATAPATTVTLALTKGANPSTFGGPLTFTATVTGGSAPAGKLTFYDGLTPLSSVALDRSSRAKVTLSELSGGPHSITANYEGDATHASSPSEAFLLTVVDARPATTTALALTSGANPSAQGASLTFTATVTGAAPSGKVAFYDRDVLLATVALDRSFRARLTTRDLPAGRRRISACYNGDVKNAPSVSASPLMQTVDAPAGNGKVKVFILAGQSNMQGYGKTEVGRDPANLTGPEIPGGLGCLRTAVASNPLRYDYLLDPANPVHGKPGWITRSDVWISFWDGLNGDPCGPTVERRKGILDTGFGVGATVDSGLIGPEYGFGLAVGSALGDQVLLIKTAWGGKSLGADFRPPSSGGTTGKNYTLMVQKVHEVLDNLGKEFPDYKGGGYELAGFGWHQGWNDRVNAAYTAEYEANLANLIRDIRAEFRVPKLPFVIANTGMANPDTDPTASALIAAQAAVADPVKHPEFAGTVITVDTRPFDYGEYQSPNGFGYHWYWNGESYFNIGDRMGAAMLTLMNSASHKRQGSLQ